MKRLSLVLLLLLVPGTAAFAFDTTRHGERIGILRPSVQYEDEREAGASTAIQRAMRKELRERGFDAFDLDMTFEDAARSEVVAADYLVEIVGGDPTGDSYGGVGIGGEHADVTLELVVARVAAQLRIYDGATLELIATQPISRRSSALVPTSIGFGGRDFFGVIAIPVAEWAQYRRIARAAARDAATHVATTVRGE